MKAHSNEAPDIDTEHTQLKEIMDFLRAQNQGNNLDKEDQLEYGQAADDSTVQTYDDFDKFIASLFALH